MSDTTHTSSKEDNCLQGEGQNDDCSMPKSSITEVNHERQPHSVGTFEPTGVAEETIINSNSCVEHDMTCRSAENDGQHKEPPISNSPKVVGQEESSPPRDVHTSAPEHTGSTTEDQALSALKPLVGLEEESRSELKVHEDSPGCAELIESRDQEEDRG